jgi:hypothetical protein
MNPKKSNATYPVRPFNIGDIVIVDYAIARYVGFVNKRKKLFSRIVEIKKNSSFYSGWAVRVSHYPNLIDSGWCKIHRSNKLI